MEEYPCEKRRTQNQQRNDSKQTKQRVNSEPEGHCWPLLAKGGTRQRWRSQTVIPSFDPNPKQLSPDLWPLTSDLWPEQSWWNQDEFSCLRRSNTCLSMWLTSPERCLRITNALVKQVRVKPCGGFTCVLLFWNTGKPCAWIFIAWFITNNKGLLKNIYISIFVYIIIKWKEY